MKQYICLASEPWSAVPTRTQHLMTRLRDVKILYFEPPATGGNAHKKPGRQLRPGLTVYALPPVHKFEMEHSALFSRSRKRLAKFIERKAAEHRFRDPVLWCTSPEQAHLPELLSCRTVVYDCDRDWPRLPLEWESDLALTAEVIFAASPGLAHHLSPCNSNIALLPNGVNYPMFSRENLETPDSLRGLNVPLLGWAGTIYRDLDLTPLLQAARDLPKCAFLLVGRVEDHPLVPTLKAMPNVAFTGQVPLPELPDYLSQFDVCLDFLRQRNIGSDIVPARIYEYFSTGKPIVSMLYEDQVELFADVIYGAHTNAEFSQLCSHALAETGDWAKCRRREYGAGAAWSERAKEVARILSTIGLY